jgi:hypothetical protein
MPIALLPVAAALLLKALLGRRFALLLFAGAQGLMEVEPLVRAMLGFQPEAGASHTLAGALLLGAVTLACKPAAEWLLRRWNLGHPRGRAALPQTISWGVAAFSAYLGTLSHLLLEALVNTEVHPLAPFSDATFVMTDLPQAQLACVLAGVIGIVLLSLRWMTDRWTRRALDWLEWH